MVRNNYTTFYFFVILLFKIESSINTSMITSNINIPNSVNFPISPKKYLENSTSGVDGVMKILNDSEKIYGTMDKKVVKREILNVKINNENLNVSFGKLVFYCNESQSVEEDGNLFSNTTKENYFYFKIVDSKDETIPNEKMNALQKTAFDYANIIIRRQKNHYNNTTENPLLNNFFSHLTNRIFNNLDFVFDFQRANESEHKIFKTNLKDEINKFYEEFDFIKKLKKIEIKIKEFSKRNEEIRLKALKSEDMCRKVISNPDIVEKFQDKEKSFFWILNYDLSNDIQTFLIELNSTHNSKLQNYHEKNRDELAFLNRVLLVSKIKMKNFSDRQTRLKAYIEILESELLIENNNCYSLFFENLKNKGISWEAIQMIIYWEKLDVKQLKTKIKKEFIDDYIILLKQNLNIKKYIEDLQGFIKITEDLFFIVEIWANNYHIICSHYYDLIQTKSELTI